MKEEELKAIELFLYDVQKQLNDTLYYEQERRRKLRKLIEDENTPIKIRPKSQIKRIFEDRK